MSRWHLPEAKLQRSLSVWREQTACARAACSTWFALIHHLVLSLKATLSRKFSLPPSFLYSWLCQVPPAFPREA